MRPIFRRILVEGDLGLSTCEWPQSGTGTCFLIHGSADGAHVWRDFAEELAGHSRVIALDLRGHGGSDWDRQGRYTFEGHVRDVLKVIRAATKCDPGPICLVGHSLGGSIAAYIAPLLGATLARLVVVDTGPGLEASRSRLVAERLRNMCREYESVTEFSALLERDRVFAHPAALYDLARRSLKETPEGRYVLKFDPAVIELMTIDRDDGWWIPSLKSVVVPVMVVRGKGSSVLSPRTAKLMVEAARHGRLEVISGAGHAVMTDNPQGFSAAVLPFLRATLERR